MCDQSDMPEQNIHEWLQVGIDNKWISSVNCLTHEFVPLTADEEREFEDGYDPCIPAVRVWID